MMGSSISAYFNPKAKSLPSITAVVLLSLITVSSGCASIRNTFDSQDHSLGSAGFYKNKIYVGVRSNLDSRFPPLYLSHLLVTIFDIPLSFVMDTLLLPYTIPVTIKNMSDAKPADAVCFLLDDISPLLLSSEGRKLANIFNESERCQMASRWREDKWDMQHAVIPVSQLESIGKFYDAVMSFVKMERDSRWNTETSIGYFYRGYSAEGPAESFLHLTSRPVERQVHEPYALWAKHEEKARQMELLIPNAGGTVTQEAHLMSEYWPGLMAFDFTDPIGTKFQVIYKAKGPNLRWVDKDAVPPLRD
jgi:uncharacterized protein YceK